MGSNISAASDIHYWTDAVYLVVLKLPAINLLSTRRGWPIIWRVFFHASGCLSERCISVITAVTTTWYIYFAYVSNACASHQYNSRHTSVSVSALKLLLYLINNDICNISKQTQYDIFLNAHSSNSYPSDGNDTTWYAYLHITTNRSLYWIRLISSNCFRKVGIYSF